MSEAMIGYLEAAMIVLGSITFALILLRTFAGTRRHEMNDHARIPFREGDDGQA